MSNRIYNVLFNLHTISGIVISAALYVIFFAGSFSFFRDEIRNWERNDPVGENRLADVDYNKLLDTLDARHEAYGRNITFNQVSPGSEINVNMTGSLDPSATEKGRTGRYFYLDSFNFEESGYFKAYSLSEFLYRLHFFAQLNLYGLSGYLLAGLVAFFFLFALITGVAVHWNKIISNFYLFRPGAKLKTIWTDAHTALGIIGLPYQFVYAVTGVCLIVGTTVMAPPVVTFLYDKDVTRMYTDFEVLPPPYPLSMEKQENPVDINALVKSARSQWKDAEITAITLHSCGDANMHISVEGVPKDRDKFTGKGKMVFKPSTGEVVSHKDPSEPASYLDGATAVIRKLHFGDYGGVGLKVVYFILGIISCFVIISGVLIWLVARDKKNIPEYKKRFNAWLVRIYLAVCLSMYPVTALTFLAVKVFGHDFELSQKTLIYRVFFYSWLLLSVLFTLKKDNFFTNRYTLLSGALLGFLVPVANGMVTGNWIWVSYSAGYYNIFSIDVFWLLLAVATLIVGLKLKRKENGGPSLPKPRKEKPTIARVPAEAV